MSPAQGPRRLVGKSAVITGVAMGIGRATAEFERMHPMGRLGEPEEVAQAIAFLASDQAPFLTGAVLPVDGGYRAH